MGGGIGDACEMLGADAIQELRAWTINTYGSTRELDYVSAMAGEYYPSPEDQLMHAQELKLVQDAVRAAVMQLPTMDAFVIVRRFGLWDTKELTLRQLGEALSLSHVMVRKIEQRARNKLRDNLFSFAEASGLTNTTQGHLTSRGNEFEEAA